MDTKAGLRQTWKTWKNRLFDYYLGIQGKSGKTWEKSGKTQGFF